MKIYQHFRADERDFIDRVLQWKEFVEDRFSAKLTDFLDPREQQIVQTVIGTQSAVKVAFFGGANENERKRAIIYPEYFNISAEEYHIHLFEIDYPKKFTKIEHPQVLGSIMSLGLKRNKFGDILIKDERVQFFAAEEVCDYIKVELTAIGHTSITLKDVLLKDALKINESWQELTTTVSSLRLDAVISAIFNISRQKSQGMIQQGLVKVNWSTIENPSFEVGVSDIISARGNGRSKMIAIEGKTKKEKWRIVAGKQK